ncbi:hypothetical protein, partial [Sporosarcina sp. P1]|uniref:hypothetical protein n=1 Tax=Sporosarcina sp. P1 TaxID=2048257 RepID=UPI001E4155AC
MRSYIERATWNYERLRIVIERITLRIERLPRHIERIAGFIERKPLMPKTRWRGDRIPGYQ